MNHSRPFADIQIAEKIDLSVVVSCGCRSVAIDRFGLKCSFSSSLVCLGRVERGVRVRWKYLRYVFSQGISLCSDVTVAGEFMTGFWKEEIMMMIRSCA